MGLFMSNHLNFHYKIFYILLKPQAFYHSTYEEPGRMSMSRADVDDARVANITIMKKFNVETKQILEEICIFFGIYIIFR